jgi:pimeloyl-ACP methyl ester carboxylesterase
MRKAITAAAAVIAAVLSGRWLFRPREDIDWRDAEAPGRIATIDGVGVHYIDRGRGPAVVLIHGMGAHTFTFRYLLPDLAKDHRVVALDLKGFGYSERPQKSDYSLGAQARLVVRLMDALGVETATLVGHSMGGEVAMRVAAGWPARVERLVLVASISGDRIPTLPPLRIMKPVLALFTRLLARHLVKRMSYDPRHVTEEVLQGYRSPARIRGSGEAVYQMMRDFRRDRSVDFKRINQPILILWASHERIVPRWALGRLRNHFPEAAVVTVERAGHLLLEERPDECISAIRSFLEATEKRIPESSQSRVVAAVDTIVPRVVD